MNLQRVVPSSVTLSDFVSLVLFNTNFDPRLTGPAICDVKCMSADTICPSAKIGRDAAIDVRFCSNMTNKTNLQFHEQELQTLHVRQLGEQASGAGERASAAGERASGELEQCRQCCLDVKSIQCSA